LEGRVRILAIDTCLAACQVAVTDGGRPLAVLSEPMERGHQERLAPMVREAMDQAGLAFADLDRIAVTVGPGSFTGLRVGLAFAKGLSVALGIPLVGIGTLEALAASAEASGAVLAAVDAKRGLTYVQGFLDGSAVTEPAQIAIAGIAARFAGLAPGRIVGPGTVDMPGVFPSAIHDPLGVPDPLAVARLSSTREPAPPHPLYLRAPDARLPGGVGR
jgi:tRNA threonylcarbamoyladenosine biosynthesis protein TsaB